jgi:hypothetical protein
MATASTGKRKRGDDDLDGNCALPISAKPLEDIGASGAGARFAPASYPFLTSSEIAAVIWNAFRSSPAVKDLTELELGVPLAAEHISSPAVMEEDISLFVQATLPHWKREMGLKGGVRGEAGKAATPVVLIVSASAARAASLLKPLAAFHARIFKGFAKHLSVDDQRAALAGPPVQLCVGTPHRLAKLLELKILSLERCKLVVLDMVPDTKRYSLLDHPNLQGDVAELLRTHLLPCIVSQHHGASSKLALFPGVPSTFKPVSKPRSK